MAWLEQDWGLGQTISQVPGALLSSDLNISKTYPSVEFTPQESSSRYEEIREVTGDWYFVTNAHFDSTNWVPINPAIQPFGYRMLSDGTRQWIDGVIGANPITWTARVTISASGALTISGTLNTHTIPSVAADTFALLAATQTLTNKSLTSPSLTSPTITGTVTAAPLTITGNFVLATGGTINSHVVPNVAADTITLLAAIQTLTGKTLTAPKIGTSLLDVNGNKWIDQSAVVSAVDGLQVTNAATANPATVALASVGTDANINLNLVSKGTGAVLINGVAAAPVPTITLKKGSGVGNYTTSSASYVDVDATNLSYTVTVPIGQKIIIAVSGTMSGETTANQGSIALTDGTTILQELITIGGASIDTPFSLGYVFTGDGAAHTFKLRFANPGSLTTTLYNSSGTDTPTMTFWMGVAS